MSDPVLSPHAVRGARCAVRGARGVGTAAKSRSPPGLWPSSTRDQRTCGHPRPPGFVTGRLAGGRRHRRRRATADRASGSPATDRASLAVGPCRTRTFARRVEPPPGEGTSADAVLPGRPRREHADGKEPRGGRLPGRPARPASTAVAQQPRPPPPRPVARRPPVGSSIPRSGDGVATGPQVPAGDPVPPRRAEPGWGARRTRCSRLGHRLQSQRPGRHGSLCSASTRVPR